MSSDYSFVYDTDPTLVLNDDVSTTEPFFDITRVRGIDSAPAQITERERNGIDGGYVDTEFENIRTIIIEGTAYAPQVDQLEAYLERIKAAFATKKLASNLQITLPTGLVRISICKSLGAEYDADRARSLGYADVLLTFKAEDPSFYGDMTSASVLYSSSSLLGRGYDKSYDYGYGGIGQSDVIVTCIVGGNRPTAPTFKINGGIISPQILNDTTGQIQKFNTVIDDTSFFLIDHRNKTVKLNGETNRRNQLVGRNPWWMLNVGVNTFRLGGTQLASVVPSLEVFWRPAYR